MTQPDPTTEPVLELIDVGRIHRRGELAVTALAGVSLEVAAGELVAIMGPSGSGKSSLLNLAGGSDMPTAGLVRVSGTTINGLSAGALAGLRRREIGYVFQELNLLGELTAAENVSLPLELDGLAPRPAAVQAEEMLAAVGLAGAGPRYPDALSGGEQQRVAIARALVGRRRLVLADEPTGALDSRTGEAILTLLRQRCDQGVAGVVVTHEPRLAAFADRVIYLRDGEVVEAPEAARPAASPAGRRR